MMTQALYPFAISLLIGLFIGIERERNHPPGSQAMGVRTFILIALTGTLTATANHAYLTFTGSLFVFLLILLSYYRATKQRGKEKVVGITTEVAAAVVFILGFLTHTKPLITGLVGITVLLALLARAKLHTFSRDTIKTKEIYATITILVIGLGILPFLPNHPIDPWMIFNPRRYVFIILILLIVQFAGYIAVRIFGHKLGMVLTGFFSGLVSSTTIFLMLPGLSKKSKQPITTLVATGIFATNAMLIETTILLSIIAPKLLLPLATPILGMLAIGFFSALPVIKQSKQISKSLLPHNPFDLWAVIKLATFLASMLAIISISEHTIGIAGVQAISFLGGLFEIHSVNVANATLFQQGKLPQNDAMYAVAAAILASYITKFFLLFSLARNRFALICTSYLACMLSVGTILFFMVN